MEAVHLCACQLHKSINIPQNTPVFVHKIKHSLWMDCAADQVIKYQKKKMLMFETFPHNALFISIVHLVLIAIRYH